MKVGKKPSTEHTLITFAEFNESRVVERVSIVPSEVEELAKSIRELRGFIEAGDPPLDQPSLIRLGSRLFSLIIRGDVKRLLDRATGAKGEIVPCEVFVEDYEIAGWPWEFLYDDSTHKFLCQELLPISRGIFTLSSHDKLTPKRGKVLLLLVIGVRPNDPGTTPAEEVKWIRGVLQTELATDAVELDILEAISPDELDRKLQRRSYDILHFFGHARFDEASGQGYLRLDQPAGDAFRFYATDFAQLLEGKGLRLVFLNACESGRGNEDNHPGRSSVAAAMLDRGIPAVIATQYSIPDVSATTCRR
jgi:CHAT domain